MHHVVHSNSKDVGATTDYLLGMTDSMGKERSTEPYVYEGDPDRFTQFVEQIPHEHKLTSICFSFEELLPNPVAMQINKEINGYLTAGMPPEFIMTLGVMHTDKGRTELNNVYARALNIDGTPRKFN